MIRHAMGLPLRWAPGTQQEYSNFGFHLCKEIVGRVAGEPYERYVQSQVLLPMGIHDMRLEDVEPNYLPGEVRRDGREGGKEFPGGHEPMGQPAGNWIASVVDMTLFLTALDGSRGRPFLPAAQQEAMLAPPPAPLQVRKNGTHFGLGWDTVERTGHGLRYGKNGGKAGAAAYIEHLPGNIDWCLFINAIQHDENEPAALNEAIQQIRAACEDRKKWPERDLFPRYAGPAQCPAPATP